MASDTPQQPELPALLPCPFCGSADPVLEDARTIWIVRCKCEACILGERSPEPDGSEPESYWDRLRLTAIERWNTRAQAAVLADRESLLSDMDLAVLRMPFEAAMEGHLAQQQFYSRVQSLLDRIGGKHESRKVVAWRWVPSEVWKEYVLTDDPEKAKEAREVGLDVEELTVAAPSKVEDKKP